jgi:cell wall-associated NlpC family hydrolase
VAGQSVTFDFLTRGADTTAAGFRKVADNTVLAARGAKVLSDAIERLGSKEDRTAAESKILAGALRQTGDAEDRVAAKAVLADAAIRRLDDALKDSASDSRKANTEADGLGKTLRGLKVNPGLLGPAVALAPALASISGVAVAAAAGIGGAFLAGGAALASFGAVAKPVLTSALTASKAVNAAQSAYHATLKAGVPAAQAQARLQAANASAQLTYNAALKGGAKPATALAAYHLTLAKNQLAYNTATNKGTFNAKAYAAEQTAIGKAYGGLSPQQIALSKQLGKMSDAWQALKAAQTPVVAGALQPWLKSVTDLTGNLAPVIAKVAPVISYLGTQVDSLVNSSEFRGFRDFIGSTGAASVSAGGSTIIDLVKSLTILLPQFDPLIREAIGWISRLGPAVLSWSSSKKASDDIQAFLQWFSNNGPLVGQLLKNIGAALKALAPGLAGGAAEEVKILSGFFAFIAKLPPSVAKPLAATAGTLLILKKLGVFPVGLKLIGLGAGWVKKLFGGATVDLGAAGMQRAGDTMAGAAAAMQRAADTMVGGDIAGGAGKGAGVEVAAEGAGAGGLWSKLLPGAKLVGGVLAISLIVDQVLQNKTNDKVLGNTNPKSWWNSWGAFAKLFTPTTNTIKADFAVQAKAATSAAGDVGVLTAAITHNGNASSQAHDARAKLISDMENAGVKSATAQADVVNYSNAVTANGAQSSQAAGARRKLISDILATSDNAQVGHDDMAAFTVAVESQGTKSDAARAARGRLIKDLENSGLSAKAAQGLVDGLQSSIDAMHGKNVPVGVTGSGAGGVVVTTSGIAAAGQGNVRFHAAAAGAFIRAGSGPTADDVPAMLSRGELVVPTHMVQAGAVDHLRGSIPGFASGGFAGVESALGSVVGTAAGFEGRGAAAAMAAGVKAALAKARAAASSIGGASGSAIADYAMSFLGQIPYVWGGTAVPGGADCSGFTGSVYRKFGISAPRTSEAQGAWVRRTGPVPGGLAFYHSPAGGADPGHVAIVRSASQVISQGGGMGPQLIGLHALPLLWTGVPPGGLPSGGGGGVANTGQMSASAIARLWTADGGPASAAANMAAIANAESGDRPGTVQTGQPPGLTGWGLYQITPTSGISQNGRFGNLLNASNNTRAAISLYNASGYSPWASDPVGRGLQGAGSIRRFAGGALIRAGTGPTADDVPAMLSRGELVVPTHMVQAGAVDHLRGRIPGFAAGGVASQGASYLRAWQTRRGGVPGAARGPVAVNPQIDAANRALALDSTLARASLPAAQHRQYAAAAAAWQRRRDQLVHERGVMQGWSGQLTGSDTAIGTWIAAAGSSKALAPSVRRWEQQRAAQEKEIAAVARMLGLHAAQQAAQQAAGPTAAQASKEGAAYLKAWQTRHGGGFGAAWGPVAVNPQIDAMTTAANRSAVLASAKGLTAAQHRAWAGTAAAEKRRLGVLTHERDIERAWRTVLTGSGVTLQRNITAAGSIPSLRADAAAWKTQLAWQKWTIGNISSMLGLTAAQVTAAQKAGTLGPGGAALPAITHTYGGDVANTTGAFLASVAAPFGAARGGLVFDRGGWLQPGWNPPMFNNTGRPEHLVPARSGSGGDVHLHLTVNGPVGSQQQLEDWYVKTANKMAQHGRLTQAVKAASR